MPTGFIINTKKLISMTDNIYNSQFFEFLAKDIVYACPLHTITNENFQKEAKEEIRAFRKYIQDTVILCKEQTDKESIKKTITERYNSYYTSISPPQNQTATNDNYISCLPILLQNAFNALGKTIDNPENIHKRREAYEESLKSTQSNSKMAENNVFLPLKKWCDKIQSLVIGTPQQHEFKKIDILLRDFKDKFGFHQVIFDSTNDPKSIRNWVTNMDKELTHLYQEQGIPNQMAGLNGKLSFAYTPSLHGQGTDGIFHSCESSPLLTICTQNQREWGMILKHEYTHMGDFFAGVANLQREDVNIAPLRSQAKFLSQQLTENMIAQGPQSYNPGIQGFAEVISQAISGTTKEEFGKQQQLMKEDLINQGAEIIALVLVENKAAPINRINDLVSHLQSDKYKYFIDDLALFSAGMTKQQAYKHLESGFQGLLDNVKDLLGMNQMNSQELDKQLRPMLEATLQFMDNAGENMGLAPNLGQKSSYFYFGTTTVAHKSVSTGVAMGVMNENLEDRLYPVRVLELVARWTEMSGNLDKADLLKGSQCYPQTMTPQVETALNNNFFNLMQLTNNHFKVCPQFNDGKYKTVSFDNEPIDAIVRPQKSTISIAIKDMRDNFSKSKVDSNDLKGYSLEGTTLPDDNLYSPTPKMR